MKEEKILQDEVMSDEELNQVSGGTQAEIDVDIAFFNKLGYNVPNLDELARLWDIKGFILFIPSKSGANKYLYSYSQTSPSLSDWSHESALGAVLAGAKYPGFDWKKMHDASYVRDFIKTNMGIDI